MAASFVTQEEHGLVRRNDPNRPRPYRFHAIFLDGATGKTVKEMEWPIFNPDAGIFPRSGGGFLFFSMESIVIYSADWVRLKELPLSQFQVADASIAGLAESPSRKALVLRLHGDYSIVCIRISTDTLDFSKSPCQSDAGFTVSDEAMAELASAPLNGNAPPLQQSVQHSEQALKGIFIHTPAEAERMLCDVSSEATPCYLPQFINNETIVSYAPFGLSVFTLAGELKFKQDFNQDLTWIEPGGRPVRPAANGERFAVAFDLSLSRLAEGETDFVIPPDRKIPATYPDQVEVFDLEQGRWIYTLNNKKNQFKHIWGLALSPAGDKLVIDSGGVIQVYALPPVTISSPPNS